MLTAPSKYPNSVVPGPAVRPATGAPGAPPPTPSAPARPAVGQGLWDGFRDARPQGRGVNLGSGGGTPLTGHYQKAIHITVFSEKEQAKTVLAVAGASPSLKAALQTQRDLSSARVLLGSYQLGLRTGAQGDLTRVKADISRLERAERTQTPSNVEKARYVVFAERLGELETSMGKKGAAQLARQTYFNSESWARLSGAPRATEAQLNHAGLPRGTLVKGEAAGGFNGEMQALNGERVDMGRVMCALDFQVNASRVPAKVNVQGLSIYNPLDVHGATLGGDVGVAIARTGPSLSRAEINSGAASHILQHGETALRGDIDGLNLAHRLQKNPSAPLAQVIDGYYGSNANQRRIEELASHSKYALRDAQGELMRDGTGHYKVDVAALGADGWWQAFAMKQQEPAIPLEQSDSVASAFHDWMKKEQDSTPRGLPF